jgi:hypothetical protein
MSVGEAQAALSDALRSRELEAHSDHAYCDGLEVLIRVGPRGSASGLSKQVCVQLLDAGESGDTAVYPLRWQATGASGRLFPALDANLGLTPAGTDASLLSIVGRYEPPLGALGKRLDHAVLAHVADATVHSLLRRLAAMMTAYSAARSTGAAFAAEIKVSAAGPAPTGT